MTIDYPQKPKAKDKAIAIGKEVARQVPGVGIAITAYEQIVPDRLEQDQERWQREVTDELNRIAELQRLPVIDQGSLAWQLALLASEKNPKGIPDTGVSHDDWSNRFPHASSPEMEEALAELADAGWIETWSDANSPSGIGGFHPTALLFAHTDPFTHLQSPREDAKEIARFALKQKDAVSAMDIEAELAWEDRRLYPALNYLATAVLPEDATDKQWNPSYPFNWLRLDGEVRRLLRRFSEATASRGGN